MPKKIILNRIKAVLAERGVSQKDLADAVGRTTGTISRICTNDNQPTMMLLYEMAKYLGVDIRELLVATPNKHK